MTPVDALPARATATWWCRCSIVAGIATLASAAVAFTPPGPHHEPAAVSRPAPTHGTSQGFAGPQRGQEKAGAAVPFRSMEAEDAATNGIAIGPDLTQGSLASEASGRRAVTLDGPGRYVEFTLAGDANALTVSGNVPDGASGWVSVLVNGQRLDRSLRVASEYSYVDIPRIAGSKTHHLFDHARLALGRDLHAGDRVRLQPDTAVPYTVDVADFEQVAPAAAQPPGSVPVTGTGADPTGATDSTRAFTEAIGQAKAAGVEVWIPPGDFRVDSPLRVDQTTLRGAGAWHSVLRSSHLIDQTEAAGSVGLHDFAVSAR